MTSIDTRLSPRHTTVTEAKMVVNDIHIGSVEVIDLSEGGAGLLVKHTFEVGAKGHIALILLNHEGSHLVQAEFRVANCQPLKENQFHLGLQFTRFLQSSEHSRQLLKDWDHAPVENIPGTERRKQSYIDLTHATMRSLAEILSSTDPRARSAASRAMQSLKLMEEAIPKRRRQDSSK